MIIWNLVFVIVICADFGILAATKRHNPRPDEIERVINETHSVMWNCKRLECPPGLGMNVHCGTSVPFSMPIKCVLCVEGVNFSNTNDYSTCKRCKICSKHEKKTGECTLEEDITDCSGICHKGFYMGSISGECHPCSRCCGHGVKYHEKQCENSGLPSTKQCRENNFECSDTPLENTVESLDHENREGLEALEIVGIVLGIILVAAIVTVVIVGVVKGWREIGSTLMGWFCYCCHLGDSNGGRTMDIHASDDQVQISAHDLELGTSKGEHNCTETSHETSDLSCNPDSWLPTETKKIQREFSRSHSHPGASPVKTQKDSSGSKCNHEQFLESPKPNRPSKGGYSPLPSEDDVFTWNSSESTDAGVQQPKKPERLAKSTVKRQQVTSSHNLHVAHVTSQLNGIPHDFLDSLLSKRVSVIPFRYYSRICVKLNILRKLDFNDHRLLGEEIGLSKDDTSYLGQLDNPTDHIMKKFDAQKGSCIGKFRKILEQMERTDVVDIIDEWLKDEWLKAQCDSSHVDGKPQTIA